jgi:hypothetical protein
MFNFPTSVLLSFPLPSEHPQTRGKEMFVFSALFMFATTVCVAIRLWTRIGIRRWIALDDVLIIIAFVSPLLDWGLVCETVG